MAREWPTGRLEQLKAMWNRGLTAREIADQLTADDFPVSRNAIIGMAQRMRDKGSDVAVKREPPPPAPPDPITDAAQRPPKKGEFLAPNGVVWPSAFGCLWPIGDPREPGFRFCRETKGDAHRLYCPGHAHKAVGGSWQSQGAAA